MSRDQKPAEGAGVGRQRAVGLREAIGEGTLPLAGSEGRALYGDAVGRAGDARQWTGSG